MAANTDRGELDVRLGNQNRTLVFRTAQVMLLEERLGCDVLAYLGKSGGTTKFLVESIFSGLSRTEKKLTPMRVAAWMDDAEDLDRQELAKEILYAIARGKPGEEGKEMVRILDEAFGEVEEEEANAKSRPLESALKEPMNVTGSLGPLPKSA